MIGTCLTGCLKSIVKGEVKISEVEFIIASTQYTSRQEMIDSIHRTMGGKYLGMSQDDVNLFHLEMEQRGNI